MDYIAIVKKREKMPKPQNQEGGQFPPITKKPSRSRFKIKLLIWQVLHIYIREDAETIKDLF